MAVVDPYRRWRKGVHYAGVVVVCLLTLAVLVSLVACLVGVFTNGRTG
ncbi:hypothetical protein Acy02nite_48130 [Actinoplanes cyaneus]|jgi:hypothetical protein|uniref:Uncharacterized protein n=1 Tax=Actinoplanes cyaneus TaxID=52696 RepID=A0A919IMA2_9ACTN|nr:hypothetical protein [Actinoplanes cyaneus]MCW2138743.1 hypothetical protein [Actinoplanes cyaneus]GID66932.1 hypothetical protein Acy02nite_48130 [Actinoplanes cyaneus]